jgi:hypothetical protein
LLKFNRKLTQTARAVSPPPSFEIALWHPFESSLASKVT